MLATSYRAAHPPAKIYPSRATCQLTTGGSLTSDEGWSCSSEHTKRWPQLSCQGHSTARPLIPHDFGTSAHTTCENPKPSVTRINPLLLPLFLLPKAAKNSKPNKENCKKNLLMHSVKGSTNIVHWHTAEKVVATKIWDIRMPYAKVWQRSQGQIQCQIPVQTMLIFITYRKLHIFCFLSFCWDKGVYSYMGTKK